MTSHMQQGQTQTCKRQEERDEDRNREQRGAAQQCAVTAGGFVFADRCRFLVVNAHRQADVLHADFRAHRFDDVADRVRRFGQHSAHPRGERHQHCSEQCEFDQQRLVAGVVHVATIRVLLPRWTK